MNKDSAAIGSMSAPATPGITKLDIHRQALAALIMMLDARGESLPPHWLLYAYAHHDGDALTMIEHAIKG